MDNVEITQADRDAADAFYNGHGFILGARGLRRMERAFAAHRKATLAIAPVTLRPMTEAPRDRTFVLVKVRDDAFTDDGGRFKHYAGRWFVASHQPVSDDGFDFGWGLFPGFGGVDDLDLEGWLPMPVLEEQPA